MGLVETIAQRLGYSKAASRAPHIVEIAHHAAPYVDKRTLWGNQAEAYQSSSWLYKAVATIARAAALVPLSVYQVTGDGTRRPIDNHPVEMLLRKPNPFWSRFEFLEATFAMLPLNGNAFWYLRPTLADTIGELWPLRPDRVTVIPSETEFVAGYVYEIDGRKIPFNADEVAHFKFFHPLQDYVGLGEVEPLSYAIATDEAAQVWRHSFFKNSAQPDTMITTDQPIQQVDFDRLKREFAEEHRGEANAHKVFWASHGLEPKALSASTEDMDFIEGRRQLREEIWQIVGLPLGMWSENATEANANVALQTLYNFTLWPMLTAVHDKITSSILPRFGENLVAEFEDIRITDRRLAMEETRVKLRTHTVNEVRTEDYDMKEIKGGNIVVTEAGTVVLGEDKPEPPPQLAPFTGQQRVVAEEQAEEPEEDTAAIQAAQKSELRRWEKWALARVKDGRWPPDRDFRTEHITAMLAEDIKAKLQVATNAVEVGLAFEVDPTNELSRPFNEDDLRLAHEVLERAKKLAAKKAVSASAD